MRTSVLSTLSRRWVMASKAYLFDRMEHSIASSPSRSCSMPLNGARGFAASALVLVVLVSCYPQQPRSTPTPSPTIGTDDKRISVKSELVNILVSVTNRDGQNVSGLKKEDFLVTDNGIPQELSFFSDEDAPVSIGIIFDRSGSMEGKKIVAARLALEKFVQTSHPEDEYFLIAFNERSKLLLDHSLHGEDVIKQLERAEPGGNTSLFDAVYLGIERVQEGVYKRKALVIISDGQDNSSRYHLKEVIRSEQESGVTVYAVGILDGMFLRERRSSQYELDDLTGSTGGRAFYPTENEEMDGIFEQIANELRHMYSIGYTPMDLRTDGSWHKLTVRVRNSRDAFHLKIRTRSGYFAAPGNLAR